MSIQNESYHLCKRLYQRCQTIIFAETISGSSTPNRHPSDFDFDVQKSAHVPPTLVGMGLLLGALAVPAAHVVTEKMVLTQSKQPRFCDQFQDEEESESDKEDVDSFDGSRRLRKIEQWKRNSLMSKIAARIPTSSPSLDELARGSAFSFDHFLQKTTKGLGLERPMSSVSLKDGKPQDLENSARATSLDLATEKLTAPTIENGHRLLNSHYFHVQIQFIMTLVDISERLVALPKPARQPSLIVELNLLNHNLPANVCIPFWCPAMAGNPHHHQIVRIALSDCVVLNSAERVPFLMYVEVIENGSEAVRKASISSASARNSIVRRASEGNDH